MPSLVDKIGELPSLVSSILLISCNFDAAKWPKVHNRDVVRSTFDELSWSVTGAVRGCVFEGVVGKSEQGGEEAKCKKATRK